MITPEYLQEQARAKIAAAGAGFVWSPFQCSICEQYYGFYFMHNGQIWFDGACGCCAIYGAERRTWAEVAALINEAGPEAVEWRAFWGLTTAQPYERIG